MVDYVNIQQGDLDDAAAVNVAIGHSNLANYVGFGLGIEVNYDASPPVMSMENGKVFVMVDTQYADGAGHEKHECLIAAHYDARDSVELPHDVNYIWAQFNIGTNDSPHIDVLNTDNHPQEDAVLIGTVDLIDEEIEELNRYPDAEFEDLTTDTAHIGDSITWPDGVTTETHPITFGERIENPNDYYDVEAANPPGVVSQAEDANSAQTAQQADEADYADEAGDSAMVGGYTAEELMSEAREGAGGEWTPILDEPYTKTSHNRGPDVTFNLRQYDYDRYRVRLMMENHHSYSTAISCNLNGIDRKKYHMINLLPADQYGNQVTWRSNTDVWTVGDVMARTHSVQDFYVTLPNPIDDGGGAPRRYPVMNAGELHTGTVRSYHLSGILTQDVDSIDELRLSTGADELLIKVQIYGQHLFPEDI